MTRFPIAFGSGFMLRRIGLPSRSVMSTGKLPEFSFIDPSCCGQGTNSMHPTGLISDGETPIKNVYDALRASPQWNQTLFVLTFDETGGFHDHVPPPLAVRPDNLTYTETAPNGEKYTFSFDRLGGRISTLLISLWVGKGLVEQKGANSDGKTVFVLCVVYPKDAGVSGGF